MRILITGGAGFVGRHLSRRIISGGRYSRLTLVDITAPVEVSERQDVHFIKGELSDPRVRAEALAGGVDVLFHLASLPGGTSEQDPFLSRKVNLETSLDLFEAVANLGANPRIVYASSIAVFGLPLPDHIDDRTPSQPSLTYGTHKRMCELALSDIIRRGHVKGLSLRLPGIVARPRTPNGLRSAFMSDVFHAMREGIAFTCPTSPEGTVWAMSVETCVDNLLHGAGLLIDHQPPHQVMTLPALRFSMGQLVNALALKTGRSASLVEFSPDIMIEAQFARMPYLDAALARSLGFKDDRTISNLVERVTTHLS